jgi:hypothetical protein
VVHFLRESDEKLSKGGHCPFLESLCGGNLHPIECAVINFRLNLYVVQWHFFDLFFLLLWRLFLFDEWRMLRWMLDLRHVCFKTCLFQYIGSKHHNFSVFAKTRWLFMTWLAFELAEVVLQLLNYASLCSVSVVVLVGFGRKHAVSELV